MNKPLASKRRAVGISLIEVLVVIVLIAFGLIGVVGLQARAVQTSVSAEDSVRASLLADEIISLVYIRGSKPSNVTAADVASWKTRIANAQERGLPGGEGDFTVVDLGGNVSRVTVEVRWTPPNSTTGQRRYQTEMEFRP